MVSLLRGFFFFLCLFARTLFIIGAEILYLRWMGEPQAATVDVGTPSSYTVLRGTWLNLHSREIPYAVRVPLFSSGQASQTKANTVALRQDLPGRSVGMSVGRVSSHTCPAGSCPRRQHLKVRATSSMWQLVPATPHLLNIYRTAPAPGRCFL